MFCSLKKTIIFTGILLIIFSLPKTSFALEIAYPPVPGTLTPQEVEECIRSNICEAGQRLPLYVRYFYNLFVMLSGLVCLITVIAGGVLYSTSVGNVSRMKLALERISAGILGTTLLLFSYGIVLIINPDLTVLSFGKPSIQFSPLETGERGGPTLPVYVEIPYGGLIEIVKKRAELVREEAYDVWEIASKDAFQGMATIHEVSQCLQILIQECKCSRFRTENCKLNSSGSGCEIGTCISPPCDNCTGVDPCDIDSDPPYVPPPRFDVATLCDLPSRCLNNPELCDETQNPATYDLNENSLKDLGTDNLREAVNKLNGHLEYLVLKLYKEIRELLKARFYLQLAVSRLRVAEALMRDSFYSGLNYDAFISIEEKEIKKLWPYEPNVSVAEPQGSSREGIVYPPVENQGDCIHEVIPHCLLCADKETLICKGNRYRCGATDSKITALCAGNDSCVDPPKLENQCRIVNGEVWECCRNNPTPNPSCLVTGCVPPRSCSEEFHWFDAGKFAPTYQLLYNGLTYDVPTRGVVIYAPNTGSCDWVP